MVAFLYSNNNLNINSIIQKPETKEDPVSIQPENNDNNDPKDDNPDSDTIEGEFKEV